MQTEFLECPSEIAQEFFLEQLKKELQPFNQFFKSIDTVYLTRKQAALIMDVCPHTINNYIRYGMLSPHVFDGCTYAKYKLSELLALKAQQSQ